MSEKSESLLRQWRHERGYSLDAVCDVIEEQGIKRPSAAKLSRIERDQKIPLELVPALETITGIPAKELRPDLVDKLEELEKLVGGAQ